MNISTYMTIVMIVCLYKWSPYCRRCSGAMFVSVESRHRQLFLYRCLCLCVQVFVSMNLLAYLKASIQFSSLQSKPV